MSGELLHDSIPYIPAGARLTKKHAEQSQLAFKRKIGLSMELRLPWLVPGRDIAADPPLGLLQWIGVAGLVGIGATVAE